MFAECVRYNREGVGNSILRIHEWNFGNRGKRSNCSVSITSMHWVCTRSKGFSGFSSIWSCSCIFTIRNVGSNGKNRSCRNSATVSVISADILHKGVKHFFCECIDTVIIISVFREISFNFKVYSNPLFITDWFYLCIFNC